ncbi:hypothetical protein [Paenibacillus campinasensis]|uniref:Uncharacterized protein n=1 Tax=Paenibacillus campinasensis TaxID=66347 RepID=A0A268EI97_9BACL|nr:hypothetical protein [Paenibacillus campinasensis]PAD72853.1 hypothetical protein CHH67_21335 [Paenibacillus campinasensis]
MNENMKWFVNFFKEKRLDDDLYVIEHQGKAHIMESAVLRDIIVHRTPEEDQWLIQYMLLKMDLYNCDLRDYLKLLAKGYILATLDSATDVFDRSRSVGSQRN